MPIALFSAMSLTVLYYIHQWQRKFTYKFTLTLALRIREIHDTTHGKKVLKVRVGINKTQSCSCRATKHIFTHPDEHIEQNGTHQSSTVQRTTRCSAIAIRPRCRVRYSFGQKWKTGTGRQYFTDIIGLSSTTVI